ncbi:hypothetical protein [Micromonospora humida]|uniref:hypothetical protein n=1 Tax=Micromonospora humida TaxID=2809018 RepID=UPI003431D96B
MTFDFGITGYQPAWLNGAAEVAGRHAQRLRGLVGRRLTSSWVVWDDDDDTWFADCPVVFDFDDERLRSIIRSSMICRSRMGRST